MSTSCVVGLGLKTLGTVSGAPYINSAKEQPKYSLGAVWMPSRTHGSSCVQLGPVSRARRADLGDGETFQQVC